MTEEWRVIPGFPGYEVSDLGQVRNASGYVFTPRPWRKGYMRAALRSNGKTYERAVHRLVLLAFVGDPGPGMEGNHKNGVKSDNRLENLEWVTPDGNTQHKMAMGLQRGAVGAANVKAKLTEDQVREIRRLQGTTTTVELAARFGVSNQLISAIHRGHVWKHVA